MESVAIDCGNGWRVRVRVVDGAPLITAAHLAGEVLSANSTSARLSGNNVEFSAWHEASHDEVDPQ